MVLIIGRFTVTTKYSGSSVFHHLILTTTPLGRQVKHFHFTNEALNTKAESLSNLLR